MHDGDILYMAAQVHVQVFQLQKRDQPGIEGYKNDHRKQAAYRIGLVKAEDEGEHPPGIVIDHTLK